MCIYTYIWRRKNTQRKKLWELAAPHNASRQSSSLFRSSPSWTPGFQTPLSSDLTSDTEAFWQPPNCQSTRGIKDVARRRDQRVTGKRDKDKCYLEGGGDVHFRGYYFTSADTHSLIKMKRKGETREIWSLCRSLEWQSRKPFAETWFRFEEGCLSWRISPIFQTQRTTRSQKSHTNVKARCISKYKTSTFLHDPV